MAIVLTLEKGDDQVPAPSPELVYLVVVVEQEPSEEELEAALALWMLKYGAVSSEDMSTPEDSSMESETETQNGGWRYCSSRFISTRPCPGRLPNLR